MKNLGHKKTKQLSHSFLIWFLPFDNSTNPQNKFVPHIVKYEHFVFSFISLAFIVNFKFWVMSNRRQGTHMQMFFHGLISHMVYPGPFLDTRSRSMFKRNNTTIASQLFGILIPCKEISKNNKI